MTIVPPNAPDSHALRMTAAQGAGCLGIVLPTLRTWARHGELKAAAGAGGGEPRPQVPQPQGGKKGCS
jgi:hypothetical protein